MKFIQIKDAGAEHEALLEAWREAETFAFVSAKSGVEREWVERAVSALPEPLQTGHFALLTSGSTGRPKLVIGSRLRAERLARVLHDLQESDAVDEAVLALPLSYCYSFVNQWLWALVHERRLTITNGFAEPDSLAERLNAADQAMICLVGVQVPLLARYYANRAFEGVIRVHFAGGRFPQEQLGIVTRCFPNATVFNNYGCAEAMPRLTLRKADEAEDASNIGRPLPGVDLRVAASGELEFRSPFGAVASVDDDGVRLITDEDWVGTGDLGRQNSDDAWAIVGRMGEVFKRHGEKVSLSRLTSTVHTAWHEQLAFYREADSEGEDGHVLLLAPSAEPEQVRAILGALRKSHPRACWPLRVESVGVLPLLSNGKIDVGALSGIPDRRVHWRQRIGSA